MKLNENEKVVLWLNLCGNLSIKKQHALLDLYESPKELWKNFNVSNKNLLELISEDDINKMLFTKDDNYINSFLENCNNQNIQIVTKISNNYPKLLLETDLPPLVLYCKGKLELLNSNCIAIVGTRRPTKYGKDVAKLFATTLANSGVTVVSGLADGIDAVAHRSALDVKGNTIAVLGSGLNEIYPLSNLALAREIEQNGLIISEYKPNEKPQTYYFPARNRIIAGLSKGVMIAEASEKSGSMHTKNYAIEYNRDLFVVPGRITDSESRGCNLIIKNLQATMVLEPLDILNNYGWQEGVVKKTTIQLDLNDEIVLSLIPVGEEFHYEEILVKSGLQPKELNTTLTRLELKGLISKHTGNLYSK